MHEFKKVGLVAIGFSDYDDKFYSVLEKYSDKLLEIYSPSKLHLGGMDYSGLFGLMAMSGVSIVQADNSEPKNAIVELLVKADEYDNFLKTFDSSLSFHIEILS